MKPITQPMRDMLARFAAGQSAWCAVSNTQGATFSALVARGLIDLNRVGNVCNPRITEAGRAVAWAHLTGRVAETAKESTP